MFYEYIIDKWSEFIWIYNKEGVGIKGSCISENLKLTEANNGLQVSENKDRVIAVIFDVSIYSITLYNYTCSSIQ